MVGELDAGNRHVQFDEGAQETCVRATRLCPTLPQPLVILSNTGQARAIGRGSGISDSRCENPLIVTALARPGRRLSPMLKVPRHGLAGTPGRPAGAPALQPRADSST